MDRESYKDLPTSGDMSLETGRTLVVASQLNARLVWPFKDSILRVKEADKEERKRIATLWLTPGLTPSTESFSTDCSVLLRPDLEHLRRTGNVRRPHTFRIAYP